MLNKLPPTQNNCLQQIATSLNKESFEGKAAAKIASTLQTAQNDFVALASDPDANPGELKAAEIKYQKILLAFEAFSKMMEAKFQTLLQGIRALSVR